MNKIEQQLKRTDLNVKTLVDWDNSEKVEQLTLHLRELQTELQSKMTQSIESHILGKQRLINTLNDALPTLLTHRQHPLASDPDLDPLLEMLQVKDKIQHSLDQLTPLVNPHPDHLEE